MKQKSLHKTEGTRSSGSRVYALVFGTGRLRFLNRVGSFGYADFHGLQLDILTITIATGFKKIKKEVD
jgi:hypothetical protein